jgi:hypothetical protein
VHDVVPGLPPRHSAAWDVPSTWLVVFPFWWVVTVTNAVLNQRQDRSDDSV